MILLRQLLCKSNICVSMEDLSFISQTSMRLDFSESIIAHAICLKNIYIYTYFLLFYLGRSGSRERKKEKIVPFRCISVEETVSLSHTMSTSSSSEPAGPSNEDAFRSPAAMISGDSTTPSSSSSSSLSALTQAFPFSSGNPRIEETRGVMHLFREDAVSSPSSSNLPVSAYSYLPTPRRFVISEISFRFPNFPPEKRTRLEI